jgi:hypothetical protein
MANLFATTTSLQTKMVGTPTFDTATTNLASACIYDAENELRKLLSKRYDFGATPFLSASSLPPVIVTLTETLAIGYMYENMARGSKDGYARADRYIKRVMDDVALLVAGEAQLVDTAGAVVDEIAGDWAIIQTTQYEPTFNEDDPRKWKIDQDKLNDIAASRGAASGGNETDG